jgi:hypothetical protein
MQKNYYAIIPANVRYDDSLTANAKLLYGEITALCNEKGYCWASNDYFAQLYNVSKISVSKWISQLVKKGYLNSTIEYKQGTKQIIKRYLIINNTPIKEKFNTPINPTINTPIKEKFNTPIKEKFKDNNTYINNNIYIDFFENLLKIYPNKKGRSQITEAKKKELYKVGLEHLTRAFKRYEREKEDWRAYKDFKTFFNKAYIDYLDENYEEPKKEKTEYDEIKPAEADTSWLPY